MDHQKLKDFFDRKVAEYNQPSFIEDDPICIPHFFTKRQDIEIAAFFTAIFSWGIRLTIINKSRELMQFMDMAPYDFVVNHSDYELRRLLSFKHRTFNATDLLYFIEFLKFHYANYQSLEDAFTMHLANGAATSEARVMLAGFHRYFFSLEHMAARTRKHIATPEKNSTCKRLNMFLRWMVRNDNNGVDFGVWKKIKPACLVCPVDLHVARVAKRFNLLGRSQVDWQAAIELTSYLRLMDAADPVKYDFALFGLGVMEKY